MMELSAFKAYDIRGKYPEEVNEDLAYLVGRALVKYLDAKVIVIGRDVRESSPSLSRELIRGINSEGADVINIGIVTTPMLNFGVTNYKADGGVMISASHNPPEDNAFKLIRRGPEMLDETSGLGEIKGLVEKDSGELLKTGGVTKKEILTDYLAHVLKFTKDISKLKIVVDYGNGVGSISAKPLFSRLELDYKPLFEEPDGTFPNHPANPHDEVNFKDLKEAVKKEKAVLGIFFDGDADRALFVDETGEIVPMDLMAALLGKEELDEKGPGNIFFDLRFTKSFPALIKKAGGTPVMLRVGNPFYKRALSEKGGLLGAEFSGHVMFPENYNLDDGLFTSVKVMNLMCKTGKKLSEMVQAIRVFESSPEVTLEAKNSETIPTRLIDAFPSAKVIELDGTYLDFPDGFISVRQSQNEPKLFRMRVEAGTKDELEKRLKKTQEIIES